MTKKLDKQDNRLDVHYDSILGDISNVIHAARRSAARSVNSIITAAYGLIGRRIVEFEQKGLVRAEYGARSLKRLSTREDFRNTVSEISDSGDISDTVCGIRL